jgi:hypothetical protein
VRLVEAAVLVPVSAITLYFFPFPFSLVCFIVTVAISASWYFFLAGGREGSDFEIRSYPLQYVLPPCLVVVLALTCLLGVTSLIRMPLAVVVTLFVPGFGILSLLEGRKGRTSFSWLGMACGLSVLFNGVIYSLLILTSLPSSSYAVVFLCLNLALALVPALKESIASGLRRGESHSIRFDELVILSVYALVLVFVILALYPGNALLPAYDITAHFTSARVASLFPTDLRSSYPFFSFNQAIVILLSGPPSGRGLLLSFNPAFQATFALIGGLVLMFAFYSLAKSQLAGLGSKVSLVATGIFMLFGGLVWTQAQNVKFGHPFSLASLKNLYAASYWDAQAGPGQSLWFWFRPITLGILFLILLLSLLATRHENPWRATVLGALLVTGLYFVHVPELMLFVALLFVLAILKPASMPGLEQVAAGLVIAWPVVALFALEQTHFRIFRVSYDVLGVLLAGSVLTYLASRFLPRPRLRIGSNLIRIIGILSLAGYGAFVVTWLIWPLSFNSTSVSALQIVPTEFYPVLLGVGGALALLAFLFIDELRTRPLVASVYLLILLFVIGRSLSLLNYFVTYTDYWERRVIPLLWIPLSTLAAFVLVKTCSLLRTRSGSILRGRSGSFVTAATLGLVVLLGTSSMMVGVWYGGVTVSHDQLDPTDLSMASYLAASVTSSHPIFSSSSEANLARYAPSVYVAGSGSPLIFQEVYPEQPLTSMVETGYGTPFVLVSSTDMINPSVTAASGYLADLLRTLPVTYSSGVAELYFLGNISAPSPSSSTCIGVSDPPGINEFLAFDLLSSVRANYTSIPNSDASLSECSSIFLGGSVSEAVAQRLLSGPGNYTITVLGEASSSFLSKMFLNATGTQALSANQLTGGGVAYNLPSTISVTNVSASAGAVASSYYESPSGETVPLSLQRSFDSHIVTFLNVQPFFGAMQSPGKTKLAIFSFLFLMAKAAGLRLEPLHSLPTDFGKFTIAFASAHLTGHTSLKTSSIVLQAVPITAKVMTASSSISVSTATQLSLYSPLGEMTISTSSATLSGGQGFYATATFTQPLVVSGSNLQGTLSFRNGTTVAVGSIVRVDVSGTGSPSILLHTPAVTDDGSVALQDLTVLNAPTFSKLVASAQATLKGDVSFDIQIGDRVSYATGLKYSGGVTYSPPLVQWNESVLLYDVAPGLGVLAVVLVWWYYFRRPAKVGSPEPLS